MVSMVKVAAHSMLAEASTIRAARRTWHRQMCIVCIVPHNAQGLLKDTVVLACAPVAAGSSSAALAG